MFRKACLLAVLFAALFDAAYAGSKNVTEKNGDKPTKSTKTKESKNSYRSKGKIVTLCVGVPSLATNDDGLEDNLFPGFILDFRANVYDCDDYDLSEIDYAAPASLPSIPEYNIYETEGTPIGDIAFTCNFAPTLVEDIPEIGEGLCSGLLSLDSKSNKKSKTSTAAFAFKADGDEIDFLISATRFDIEDPTPDRRLNNNGTSKDPKTDKTKTRIVPKLNSVFEINTMSPIVTATNGAWPKPETFKNFFIRVTGTEENPQFLQLVIEYYKRAWNPASLHY